jgi:hypothetical protein
VSADRAGASRIRPGWSICARPLKAVQVGSPTSESGCVERSRGSKVQEDSVEDWVDCEGGCRYSNANGARGTTLTMSVSVWGRKLLFGPREEQSRSNSTSGSVSWGLGGKRIVAGRCSAKWFIAERVSWATAKQCAGLADICKRSPIGID